MKKTLSTILALVLALALALGCVGFAAAEAEKTELSATAYLMYADGSWTNQYWGEDAAGVTAKNAEVTGEGAYTVGLEFAEEAKDLAFTAIGINGGEIAFPTYSIELKEIRVNGEAIEFAKGYTSSDDGITTRMNIYNEWVTELPIDAHTFDGSLEGAAAIIVDKAAFASVKSVEVDFVFHEYGVDTAYIMYADEAWAVQYWNADADGVTAKNAVIDGFGDYTVGLEFATEAKGLAFTALGIACGELTYPGAYLKINEIRVNGEAIEFTKGYTSSDDGITTRMNIYNEWVTELPIDARSFDGKVDDAKAIIVDKAAFASVKSVEIDFSLIPVTDIAFIAYANADWSIQNWGAEDAEGVKVGTATINGQGSYTVSLDFDQPSDGLAFAAVYVANGENTFGGYFIDVTDVKVNGESIKVDGGYTTSDDGITTRENLYNEWVTELPADARRADGVLEGYDSMIVDKDAFTGVKSIEVTFDYIYGKPAAKAEDAPMTQEEADAAMKEDLFAYIGVQGKDTYVFRNAWNDNYGMTDTEHNYFDHLTGWGNPDTEDHSDNLGGTFEDVQIKGNGTYTVSLTTGERGFTSLEGATEAFNLLYVSTNIPAKLVKDGFLTVSDVKTTIGSAAAKEGYASIDTTGDYLMIRVIDTYNTSEDPFGYTVPGANEKISISFTLSGFPE